MNLLVRYLVVSLVMFTTGCATYSQKMNDGLSLMDTGDYRGSMMSMEGKYKSKDDLLLKQMELGLLAYLDGQYQESITYLDQAEDTAEVLYTKRLGDLMSVYMSNPRSGAYAGTEFERVFIYYYKALNYLQLASVNGSSALENARIEIRKIDILLNAIATEEGDYRDLKEKKSKMFTKVLNVFSTLYGGNKSVDEFIYREDAYARYINAVIYEKNAEYDDARIAYTKAAELYESGFSHQYGLGQEIIQLAWIDAVRMMEKVGGFEDEVASLKGEKLTEDSLAKLSELQAADAHVLVLQHLGRIPQRDEMNLRAKIDANSQEMVISLFAHGDEQQRLDQEAWFAALYADRGIMDFVNAFSRDGSQDVGEVLTTKRLSLGAAWGVVESVNLHEAMGGTGVRVTVPYYRSFNAPFSTSQVSIDGGTPYSLTAAQSLATMAVQEQLVNAASDINAALTREAIKNVIGNEISKKTGLGSLGGMLSKVVSGLTSAAETRNWLTLPYEIRIARIPVTAGQHELKILTQRRSGALGGQKSYSLDISRGDIRLITERTVNGNSTNSLVVLNSAL